MKAVRVVFVVVALALASAGSAWAQKVTVDFDRAMNFQGLRTYSWVDGTPAKNPLMHQRIIDGVDRALAAKGFQKVEAGASPDLHVTYHSVVDVQTQLNTVNMGGVGWRGLGAGTASTTVEHVQVAALQVNIGDPKANKLLWQGTATDAVSDNPQKNEEKINKALTNMFKKFPPPPPKT